MVEEEGAGGRSGPPAPAAENGSRPYVDVMRVVAGLPPGLPNQGRNIPNSSHWVDALEDIAREQRAWGQWVHVAHFHAPRGAYKAQWRLGRYATEGRLSAWQEQGRFTVEWRPTEVDDASKGSDLYARFTPHSMEAP